MKQLITFYTDSLLLRTGIWAAILAYSVIILLIAVVCIFLYVFHLLNLI